MHRHPSPAERGQGMTEYIIIGTFLSFGWGLLVSVLTKAALDYWQ